MNATNRVHCIQKWIVLPRDFSISGGELGKICCLFFFKAVFQYLKGGAKRKKKTDSLAGAAATGQLEMVSI